MKFIYKWLREKLRQVDREDQPGAMIKESKLGRESFHNPRNSLNFYVYYASGGMIIETRIFNPKKDEWENQLHIVTEKDDLSEMLSRIITVQMLTR
jgi:hypothetical protein